MENTISCRFLASIWHILMKDSSLKIEDMSSFDMTKWKVGFMRGAHVFDENVNPGTSWLYNESQWCRKGCASIRAWASEQMKTVALPSQERCTLAYSVHIVHCTTFPWLFNIPTIHHGCRMLTSRTTCAPGRCPTTDHPYDGVCSTNPSSCDIGASQDIHDLPRNRSHE